MSSGNALLSMTSPLGRDVLLPIALLADEAISEPFRFVVDLVSERNNIDPKALLNQPACIALSLASGAVRHFHGVIAEFAPEGTAYRRLYSAYRAVLVPRVWMMGLTRDCRVYQAKSTADILTAMLGDMGVRNFDLRIYGPKPVREYTVQYNESDLHFASRLLEEEGWFYFFEHGPNAHKLVVTDANTGFTAMPGARLRFDTDADVPDVLRTWRRPHQVTHGEVALRDYDPTVPDKRLAGQQATVFTAHAGAAARDVFTWPARTTETKTVNDRAKLMMEAAEAAASLAEASGVFGSLFAGGRYILGEDPGTGAAEVPYVVQRIRHTARDDSWVSGGSPPSYANAFSTFPTSVPWRQAMNTPRPHMAGLHAAVVLGPVSDDIFTDEQARVKVRFFWDHRKEATHDLSVWARVVQPWAGPGWGAQFIPRVGTEVAVAFMNGDVDCPVVVGGLYNGRDKPIYPAAQKTKSGLRTRSSIKGGANAFSELTFDDLKGKEMVLLHAQKDLTTEVENDQALLVDRNRKVVVKGEEDLSVKGNRTHEILQGDDSLMVRRGNLRTEVKLGNVTVKATTGAVTIEALRTITLKVGQSSVTLTPAGVQIKGMTVSVQGTLLTEVKGVVTKVTGMPLLVLQGVGKLVI